MSGNSTPVAEALRLLKQRKEQVDLEKAIAEAETAVVVANQAKLKAQLPAGDSKPLDGATTTDDKFGYIAELVSYDAMNQHADAIAGSVSAAVPSGARILIVDSLDFADGDVQSLQVESQIGFLKSDLQKQVNENEQLLNTPSPSGSLQALDSLLATTLLAAPALLSTVADLVGYFRVNYAVKGRDVKVSRTALHARVAAGLTSCEVYRLNFHQLTSVPLITDFNSCINLIDRLRVGSAQLRSQIVDPQQALIQNLTTAMSRLDEHSNDRPAKRTQLDAANAALEVAEAAVSRSDALIKAFDVAKEVLMRRPEQSSHSVLESAALRQYVRTVRAVSHLLYLDVTSSGGEAITSKSVWSSGDTRYVGGVVLTYILAETTGRIIAGNSTVGLSSVKLNLGRDELPSFDRQPLDG